MYTVILQQTNDSSILFNIEKENIVFVISSFFYFWIIILEGNWPHRTIWYDTKHREKHKLQQAMFYFNNTFVIIREYISQSSFYSSSPFQ